MQKTEHSAILRRDLLVACGGRDFRGDAILLEWMIRHIPVGHYLAMSINDFHNDILGMVGRSAIKPALLRLKDRGMINWDTEGRGSKRYTVDLGAVYGCLHQQLKNLGQVDGGLVLESLVHYLESFGFVSIETIDKAMDGNQSTTTGPQLVDGNDIG